MLFVLSDSHTCRRTHGAAGRAEASSLGSPERTRWHIQAGGVSRPHASGHWAGSGGGASSLGFRTVNRAGGVPAPSPGEDGTWAPFSLKESRDNGSTPVISDCDQGEIFYKQVKVSIL